MEHTISLGDLVIGGALVAALLVGGVYLWHVYRPARLPLNEGDLPARERPPSPPRPPRPPTAPPPGASMGP
jgi:hypothetical protein